MGFISLLVTLLLIGMGVYMYYGDSFDNGTRVEVTPIIPEDMPNSISGVLDSAENAKELMERNNINSEAY